MSDLWFFAVLLVIFMVAYSVILHAVRSPNTTPGFNFVALPYFNMFGELFLENIFLKGLL